jgi:hypothetical protein
MTCGFKGLKNQFRSRWPLEHVFESRSGYDYFSVFCDGRDIAMELSLVQGAVPVVSIRIKKL